MSPRDGRALRVGALLIAAALVLRVAPPLVGLVTGAHHRLTARTEVLRETRALIANVEPTRDSLATAVAGLVALAPDLIEGSTQAEANAALVSAVGLLAARSALKVVRLDPAADSAAGPIRSTTVRGEFEGDISGLAAFLRALEEGQPLLSAGALAITAPDPVPRPGTPEVLHIEIEVTGWYLPREAP
jgi:hypothetical protein